jgi:hypothetical protein
MGLQGVSKAFKSRALISEAFKRPIPRIRRCRGGRRSHWSVSDRQKACENDRGAKRRAPLECPWAKSQGEQTDRLRIGRLGLTHRARPLYSRPLRDVGLARPCGCPCGGIGRRARLKIEFRKECWFDSGQGHQVKNMNNNNNLQPWLDSGFLERFSRRVENTHTKVHCSRPFCSHFCWHQLALRFALLISAAFCFRIESKDQRRIRASDKGQAVD